MNIIVGNQFHLVVELILSSNFAIQCICFYIFLGNVYRGCARKRCALSHTVGTFSSSVCCQTDYCNSSTSVFARRKYDLALILTIILSTLMF